MSHSLESVLDQHSLHIRIWKEEGVYVAQCLDIPGCVSQGLTHDEALANIHDAIALCLQVIREDVASERVIPDFEILECPIQEFMNA